MNYPNLPLNCLINSDSRDGMSLLPDTSVDLILTSPPYSDLRSYPGSPPEQYCAWFTPFAEQMLRILTPDGSLIINIGDRCLKGERIPYSMELTLLLRKMGLFLIDEIIWVKGKGLHSEKAKRAANYWERILHFSRSTNPYFDPDPIRTPYPESSIKRATKPIKINTSNREGRLATEAVGYKEWKLNPLGSFPKNVVYFKQDLGRDHVASFDISLPTYFIQAYSQPGSLILDPFAGRGTTLSAVRNLNGNLPAETLPRRYLGFEIMPEYVALARDKYGLEVVLNADPQR